MTGMERGRINGTLLRGIADFALALAVFWAIALGWGVNRDGALAVSPAPLTSQRIIETAASQPFISTESRFASPVPAHEMRTSRRQALWLLSLTLAAIFALNLAFWRHLRRVYASPRRGVWRRG